MDTKKIIAILKNIVSNKREVDRGEQLDLSFNVEETNPNRAIFEDDEMRAYTVEEVADLINRIDVEQLDENDINYIKSLYRRLESDNVNNDIYRNEEALIGPLSQKINEYDHVVTDTAFNSNQREVDELIKRNNNLASIKLISLPPQKSDSQYRLEYLSITNERGEAELIALTDPDYLERFSNEFASQIESMTPGEFARKLKASTEANLDFVKLETYLTDENVRIRMHEPAIKDNNVLGYEYEEVRRLVDQFMPGEDIYVSIDKYGEIFYRVADGIIKGKTYNGKREVEFIQVPSRYKSNEKTETNEDNQIKEANADQQNVKNPEEKSMGDMNVSVKFEINKFYNLFDARDAIMHGDDPDVQNQLISQISALFDLCFKQQVDNNLIQCINTFYNENKDEYEHVKNSGTMINGKRMNLQEYKLLEKLDNAYKSALSQKTEEQVDEEINEFGIEGTTVEEGRNNIVDFDRSVEKRDVKVRKRTLPKANAAFTMITIILEILTVAIIIMMFLSLDI